MKLVNPLDHPLAVLAGGIVLIGGVRIAKLPSLVMVPLSVGVATAGAAVIAPQAQQTPAPKRRSPELEKELTNLLAQARKLAQKANSLKAEAQGLLTQSLQMELLGTLQYACDRTTELPQKIEAMTQRLQGDDSILSVQEPATATGQALQQKLDSEFGGDSPAAPTVGSKFAQQYCLGPSRSGCSSGPASESLPSDCRICGGVAVDAESVAECQFSGSQRIPGTALPER